MAKKLTNRQKAFVEAYLANGFNATQAAITAGYSVKTAYSQGSRLLRNVEVQAVIRARMVELAMSAEEAMLRLSEHARGDMGDFLTATYADLQAHPQSRLIKKIKRTTVYTGELPSGVFEERIELELYDAQSALALILKEQHLRAGEPTDHTRLSGVPNLPDDQLDSILKDTASA